MKNLLFLLPVFFLFVSPVHAEVWPDGPYPNHSEYWANRSISALEVKDVWKTADIMGFDKARFDSMSSEVYSLRNENISLNSKIQNLEARITNLESSRSSQPQSVNTTIVQQADMSRVEKLEKDVRIIQGVVSMMEVNIGSLYARMDQLLAPILKKLGL